MLTRSTPPLTGPRFTIHGVLIIGFVLIFALAVGFAWNLNRRLAELERRASTMQARLAESDGLLLTVSGQLLLGTVYLRDALLEGKADEAGTHLTEMEAARAQIERALQQYPSVAGSELERLHWTRLRVELDRYWTAMLPALTPAAVRDPQHALALLGEQAIPRRRTIIQMSERIRSLNREAYNRQAAELAGLYDALRADVWRAGGLAAALAVLIAGTATRYAGSLEARLRRQQLQAAEQKYEVERLSSQLVRAQEEERRALARELHDEVGQALTAVKLELADADRRRRGGDTSAALLDGARAMTDGALHAVRDVSQLLNPQLLDTLGLRAALEDYVARFSARTGVATTLRAESVDGRFDSPVEICAYRVVQEALNNVAKHARATSCLVTVSHADGRLGVQVEDDGQGMGHDRRVAGGLGLVGIRERALSLGGHFSIEPTAGRGTRLTVSVPAGEPRDTDPREAGPRDAEPRDAEPQPAAEP